MTESESQEELQSNIFDHKKEFADKIPEFYKLTSSLSAVMLSLIATLYQKPETTDLYVAFFLQGTILSLLLNVVSGAVSIYGRVNVHLDKVNSILRAVEDQGGYDSALRYLRKNPLIFQPKIFAWSHYLCMASFLMSQVGLAFFVFFSIK